MSKIDLFPLTNMPYFLAGQNLFCHLLFLYCLGDSNLITVRLKKKKKKSHIWCPTDDNFLSDSKKNKNKRASFKNILCKGDSINYEKLSML